MRTGGLYEKYIIQLDNDSYGWSFLWHNTICGVYQNVQKVEIISITIPMLLVETDEAGYEAFKELVGIKNIEEDRKGYLG
jgi:hypothetical protein